MQIALKLALAAPLLIGVPAVEGYPWHPPTSADINAHDILARDRAFSHDAFKGRMPGSTEGEHAAKWVADEMKLVGIRAGNHGSFYQAVPGVNITLNTALSHLSFDTPNGALEPKLLDDVVFWTPQFASKDVTVANSPLVFVGYGIVAPEFHWNDYAGVDVRGKTVVILVNDPGNEDAHPDPKFFGGKAMTYYGRWTYKFEEASRQGAAAAIIVHETGPAAYGWEVVRNSNSGTKSWLADSDEHLAQIEGWMTLDTAKELFKRAGLDYLQLKAAANRPGFRAMPMNGEALTAEAHSEIVHFETRNVVGIIPGSVHPDQVVLFTAHWDHLGMKPVGQGKDRIFNGAIDNGMGVSMILELGEAFAAEDPHPARSIAIVSFTMEEQNLLGSHYFADHLPWPADHIVGGVNLDANLPEGPAHDLVLFGSGASELEDILADVLKTQHRVISPDPEPEKGYYYRSDHLSLAKIGVPMLYPMGGYDLVDGGVKAGKAIRDDYFAHRYHQPSDEFDEHWDLTGPVEDLQALYSFGNKLANSDQWPNWHKGNEFRAIRDKSLSQ